jgi:hypothetical protein
MTKTQIYSENYGPSALATINKDRKLLTLPLLDEINLLYKFAFVKSYSTVIFILHLASVKSMVNPNVVIAFPTTKAITKPTQELYAQLNP